MKIATIILARMGSSRLPGKIMMDLAGKPVLEHIVRRMQTLGERAPVIVATTDAPQDDVVEELCAKIGCGCFRGSEDNVLQRCIDACAAFDLDACIRIGGDSPLIDPEIIGNMLDMFLAEAAGGNPPEYVSNNMDRSYPLGLDAEIFLAQTFRKIDEGSKNAASYDRKLTEENVVTYLHAHPELFEQRSFFEDFDYSAHRWTLDTPEDFELIRRIYDALYPVKPLFGMRDALNVLEEHPEWSAINAKVVPVTGFWTEAEREKFRRRYGQEPPRATEDGGR